MHTPGEHCFCLAVVVVLFVVVVVLLVVVVVSSLQLGGLPLYLGRHRHTASWLVTLQSEFAPQDAPGHGSLHLLLNIVSVCKAM